jgi:hypothetical protein
MIGQSGAPPGLDVNARLCGVQRQPARDVAARGGWCTRQDLVRNAWWHSPKMGIEALTALLIQSGRE